MSKSLPIVAIVGRANVGKSSLFNAILDRREAIVAREAGTTRDSIMAKAEYGNRQFWIVDTAGLKTAEDEFEFTIQEQITQAADSADVIWVVVDASTIITEEDRRVAKMAFKSSKPVFLVVNKIDKTNKNEAIAAYGKLGIKTAVATSTTQRIGIDELLGKLADVIPEATLTEDDNRLRIAILGRPNVGKSQLFNALAKKQQSIVADRAGTTRDINRAIIRYKQREIELMDTAGIRRSGKIERGVERFSVIRALAAIEQADVCLLLMDVNELNVQLDQKIAGMIKDAGKGLVLVVSKWDAVATLSGRDIDDPVMNSVFGHESTADRKSDVPIGTSDADRKVLTKAEKRRRAGTLHYGQNGLLSKDAFTRDILSPQIARNYEFVPWAPLIFTSAITGQNVTKLFDLALEINTERSKRIQTSELNKWLREAVDEHPPAGLKNRQPKLNYITQETDNPTPAFKIFGSQTHFVHWSYRRYLEKKMRERFGYAGTPVQLWFIEKHIAHKHGKRPSKGVK